MVRNISQIVYQLFQKETLEEVSESELRYFIRQYPYVGMGHLLLAKKLQLDGEKRAFDREISVTSVYFNNPAWLQFVLREAELPSSDVLTEDSENVPKNIAAVSAEDEIQHPEELAVSKENVSEFKEEVNSETADFEKTATAEEDDQEFAEEEKPIPEDEDEQVAEIAIKPALADLYKPVLPEDGPELPDQNKSELRDEEQELPDEEQELPEKEQEFPEEFKPEFRDEEPGLHVEDKPVLHNQESEPDVEDKPVLHGQGPELVEEVIQVVEAEENPEPLEEKRPEDAQQPAGIETPAQGRQEKDAGKVAGTTEPQTEGKLEFDPYYTIDYFASQGIKLKMEDYSKDKLGQQLKSFTEWIRSMKRLPQQVSENNMNETDQHSIRRIAEHSVEEKEVLTESMAEVWVKQGNYEKARQVYRKLSLQNPSKSTYFAAKIEQIKVL